jgi:multiple sugar transport system substrate-binding protein
MNTFSKYRLQRQIGMVLTYAGIGVALMFFLFPFVWILTTSLKGNDGDIHTMFYNRVAFERPENNQTFREKDGYDLAPPQTWKQWDDQAAFYSGWGWDGSDRKLFGAGASYKENNFSFHWWRQRFFAYGGQYFDENMKPLINSKLGVRALQEMVDTIQYYPPGVLLFEAEEPKTMVIKGEVPMLVS